MQNLQNCSVMNFYSGPDYTETSEAADFQTESNEAVDSQTERSKAVEGPDPISTLSSETVNPDTETSVPVEVILNQSDSATASGKW